MLMDASVTGKIAATEALLEEARGEEKHHKERWAAARERAAVYERELRRLRDLAKGSTKVSLESVRDVVMQFRGAFTDSELASQLGVPAQSVKGHLKEMVEAGTIRDTGEKFNRKVIYEYAQPIEAGSAFEAQQRLQPEPEKSPMGDSMPVKIVHAPRGIHKDIRRVVKSAMERDWKVDQEGSGHYVLSRGKQKVRFASTPKNPSIEAMHLKRNIDRAERVG